MFDLLVTDVHLATMAGKGYGIVRDAAVGIGGDRILWCGAQAALPTRRCARHLDGGGRFATPGLIDCHTHLVYAGNRAGEFEARLEGASYADIARAGGGIAATVQATRQASEDALVAASAPRLAALADEGVTTVEIKSGYGLERESETKLLRAARRVAAQLGVDVRTTLLAAHALPPEYADRRDAYIDVVCREIVPAVAAAGLADAVDAFCEHIAFTPAETRRVFAAAGSLGLAVKLHADQLSNCGGAALAAEFGALSADHLEYTDAAGVAAMAAAGTVAVLLPGAFYTLREKQPPPIAALRGAGVPMALATDCNPGTAPVTSLLLMLNMGCTLFGLTPAEALAGVTRHAARALGLTDRGRLEAGARADLALWNVERPGELAYRIGANPLAAVIRAGRESWQERR